MNNVTKIIKIALELNPEKKTIEFVQVVFPVKSETENNYILKHGKRVKKDTFWNIRDESYGRTYRYSGLCFEDSIEETKEKVRERMRDKIVKDLELVEEAYRIFHTTMQVNVREYKDIDI